MSSTLALASAIAEMDRDALARLVRARRPQAPSGVVDPIGLAAELLRPESIARAIAPLDRASIDALLMASDASDPDPAPAEVSALTELGLLGKDGSAPAALEEVTAALQEALGAVRPGMARFGTEPEDRAPDSESTVDTGTWYSPALTAVGQAFEVLAALRDRPGKINRNGTTAVATMRALSEITGISVDDARRTLEELRLAGLTTPVPTEQALVVSAAATAWAGAPHAGRWISLARGVLASAGPALRTAIERRLSASTQGADLRATIADLPRSFPLLPEADLAAAGDFADLAEHLGLTVQGRLSPPALALLADDHDGADALLHEHLPGIAPGVYVQPDLSIVLPGPLDPADEIALARLSRPEHVGVASTRRVSESSLAEAFDRGWTAEDARALFERLSLTGIPQPLDYLLSSLASRMSDIVVSDFHGDEGRTSITVSRPDLAQTLLVDRSLQHLQLTRLTRAGAEVGAGAEADGTDAPVTLLSRLRADHVFAALGDARYPAERGDFRAAAQETDRDPEAGPGAEADSRRADSHGPTANAGPAADDPESPVAAIPVPDDLSPELSEMVDRVHRAARSDPGTGDFTRRLELAIRDRTTVNVTAEASGQTRTFLLLPVSLSGGRLRATDQAAGVERTLPVNLIVAVDPT